jgi:hypothetical protein
MSHPLVASFLLLFGIRGGDRISCSCTYDPSPAKCHVITLGGIEISPVLALALISYQPTTPSKNSAAKAVAPTPMISRP